MASSSSSSITDDLIDSVPSVRPESPQTSSTKTLDELIKLAQDKLGALINRPRVTEKLLQRPPVKFVYDVVSEIAIVTGFGREITSMCSEVNTKDDKLKFVTLLHSTIEHALHRPIDLNPMRVICGKDAEKTNVLLLSLYEAATLVPYRLLINNREGYHEGYYRVLDETVNEDLYQRFAYELMGNSVVLLPWEDRGQKAPKNIFQQDGSLNGRSSEAFQRAIHGEPLPKREEELLSTHVTVDESNSDSADDDDSDDETLSESSSNLSREVEVSNARVKDMLAKTIRDERRMSDLLAEIDIELDNNGDGDDAANRVRQRKAQFKLLKLCASVPVPNDESDTVDGRSILGRAQLVEDPALACRPSRPSATTNATLKEKYESYVTVSEDTDRTVVDRETDLLTLLRTELSEGWLSYLTSSPSSVLIAKHTEGRVIAALNRLLRTLQPMDTPMPAVDRSVEDLQDAVLALINDDDDEEDWERTLGGG